MVNKALACYERVPVLSLDHLVRNGENVVTVYNLRTSNT